MYESTFEGTKVLSYMIVHVLPEVLSYDCTLYFLFVPSKVRKYSTRTTYNNIVVRNLDADFSNNMWIVDYVYTCTVRSPLSPELA